MVGFKALQKTNQELSVRNRKAQRLFVAALREMEPTRSFYPDANSTMRMTYGKVLDYYPADAVHYNYFTTLDGVMAKEDPTNQEFIVPAKLNGNGQLIGIAFDGNWEAMSGNILFEPELQRTINVDVRYVLFVIDKYAGASNLIKELKIVQ